MKLLSLACAGSALAQEFSKGNILKEGSIPTASFTAPVSWDTPTPQLPNVYNSTAVNANEEAPGYKLVNVTKTSNGLSGLLTLRGEPKDIYGYDYSALNLTVSYQAKERLNVHVQPLNLTDDIFILPEDIVPRPKATESFSIGSSDLVFEYDVANFGFAIVRKTTSEILFDTRGNPLVFENQFLQFNTSLPKGHVISGLGDNVGSYEIAPGTNRTLSSNDNQNPINKNLYGNYPVYYDQRYDTNTTHAVWWRTSAIQEVIVEETSLTWRALSGVLDLYFFSGPTPADAIRQYVSAIGLPAFQQYWTLGYHHCRWGYTGLDEMKDVRQNFKDANIPVETFWNDLDYMDRYLDFTLSPHFQELPEFIDELHEDGQHWVPILDAAIYVPGKNTTFYPGYAAYTEGHDMDIFIKNSDGEEYIGMVWPGFTVWPDFFNNNTQSYWNEQLVRWYATLPFDGLWDDMNEPSSFIRGSVNHSFVDKITGPVNPSFGWGAPSNTYPRGVNVTNGSYAYANISYTPIDPPKLTKLNATAESAQNYKMPGKGNILHPPYAIEHYNDGYDLDVHHMSPDAKHSNGFVEYDLNGVFAHMETRATYHSLLETRPNVRPFVISRSGFTGSGNWTGHWGGDNFADWAWARLSIAQYFQISSSAGIPFFGVDACGFNGNTDMELCSRWMQLASFFPFFRNHNSLGMIAQEPYLWDNVAEATRVAINIRYLLLPYHYTLLHEAHTTGMPVLRQMKWLFPNDKEFSHVDDQFFLGNSLLVTPVLEPNTSTVTGVFPYSGSSEIYYDWYTHQAANFTKYSNVTLNAPLGHIPIHIRGGSVIPTQEPADTIRDSRKNPFGLIVALDKDGKADGELYIDDGESVNVTDSLSVSFIVAYQQLSALPVGTYNVSEPLANVTIMGVKEKPQSVYFGNNSASFDYSNSTVFVTGLEELTSAGAWTDQFTLSWN